MKRSEKKNREKEEENVSCVKVPSRIESNGCENKKK